MTTKTRRDADSREAVEARDRERREREGTELAQGTRGPDRSPPAAPTDRERDERLAKIQQAEHEVEAIHAARETALRRARERVRKFEHEARRLAGSRDRNRETALDAFDRLVSECTDDGALAAHAASWMQRLQKRDATPPAPPDELLTRYLLGQPGSEFAAWLRQAIDGAYAAGDSSAPSGLDPRTHAELDAEIERVHVELDAAKADMEVAEAAKREAAAVLNQHLRGGNGAVLFPFLDTNAKESR